MESHLSAPWASGVSLGPQAGSPSNRRAGTVGAEVGPCCWDHQWEGTSLEEPGREGGNLKQDFFPLSPRGIPPRLEPAGFSSPGLQRIAIASACSPSHPGLSSLQTSSLWILPTPAPTSPIPHPTPVTWHSHPLGRVSPLFSSCVALLSVKVQPCCYLHPLSLSTILIVAIATLYGSPVTLRCHS